MVSYDPNEAVPMVVNGAINALKAAAQEPSIKRVVMTSSSTAAASPQPNVEFSMDESTWNEEAVEAAWKWMQENKPGFIFNTVLPNANMGAVLSPEHQGTPSTAGRVKALWDEFKGQEKLAFNPPQYFVNVQDTVRVHVGALIYPDVNGERLFDFAYPCTWNDILAIFRKLYPDHHFMANIPNLGKDPSKVANELGRDVRELVHVLNLR
ncbi:uncharacterized protein Z518_09152 [Rhinocladiella mackenziei CBS 650.93]|uniref:Rhinocladiella mackenziei CBS 650.93 unplaced genomic scaffold supercont1.7, whole genome shotgun sequence n=1 Tax=Rhinocladiella mackenziei CBS 650.93 TaxID=1442369 RepID=A0A0D2IDU5_9EURO|nr:uncharacterized protein Z518_09152 [Rhinocladiella mackenziei CBS 650.93]KIX01426.1 hypothetical protein Z518_09152 [Rhinocladiella mackenziei CBS 650.93]